MQIFGPIIYSSSEPTNKYAIWYNKGKLLYYENGSWDYLISTDPQTLQYETSQDKNIRTVKQALDKLLYVPIALTSFDVNKAGTYEIGQSVENIIISWKTNKEKVQWQKLNNELLDSSLTSYSITKPVSTNTTYTISVSDGTTSASRTGTISFVTKIYAGVYSAAEGYRTTWRNFITNRTLTVNVLPGYNMWVFVPNAANATKLLMDSTDCTSDFNCIIYTHRNDQGVNILGKLYTSKNASLGNVTLTIQ